MINRKLPIISILLFCFAGEVARSQCKVLDDALSQANMPVVEREKFRLASLNTKELEWLPATSYQDETGKLVELPDRWSKSYSQMNYLGRHLRALDADVITLQEIKGSGEGLELTLKNLNDYYLGGNYRFFSIPDADTDTSIVYAIRSDLNIDVELRSHANYRFPSPYIEGEFIDDIFTKDLPVAIIRETDSNGNASDQPIAIIGGIHLKSKRTSSYTAADGSSKPDDFSNQYRTAEMNAALQVMGELESEFPNTPVLMMGDFNTDINYAPEVSSLRQSDFMNVFDHPAIALSNTDRVTHSFFDRSGRPTYAQLDGIFVSDDVGPDVVNAGVYRPRLGKPKDYRLSDEEWENLPEADRMAIRNGLTTEERPLPASFAEREKNFSDHFPVYVQLNFRRLLNRLRRNN